jgi:hypothetical protein
MVTKMPAKRIATSWMGAKVNRFARWRERGVAT